MLLYFHRCFWCQSFSESVSSYFSVHVDFRALQSRVWPLKNKLFYSGQCVKKKKVENKTAKKYGNRLKGRAGKIHFGKWPGEGGGELLLSRQDWKVGRRHTHTQCEEGEKYLAQGLIVALCRTEKPLWSNLSRSASVAQQTACCSESPLPAGKHHMWRIGGGRTDTHTPLTHTHTH